MSHAIYNMEETHLSFPFLYWGITDKKVYI